MTRVALLQARTNSARLPAKVLLPLAGMPLAALAARRAGNTGIPVIVATSAAPSDDELARVSREYRLEVFRGSLDDTLGRMAAALRDWPDETVVIRLTADNPVPDGALLDALTEDFAARDVDYLLCGGAESGLPYGVSAEVFRLELLRAAAAQATERYDREHVTPWIRRHGTTGVFVRYADRGLSALRCTIDCRDDYELMARVFGALAEPVTASLNEVLDALRAHWPYPVVPALTARKLVLGTAQLGMPYGVANTTGMPDAGTAARLLKTAIASGVEWLDTARAYGASEQVIGSVLNDGWQGRARVITKLGIAADCAADAPVAQVRACVDASVFRSAAALGQARLDVVMLHRAQHLTAWDGAVPQRLRELVTEGSIGQLGVSVQDPSELLAALDIADLEFIQLPFNLLDWRWDACVEPLRMARRDRPLTVHARSTLLQGLLVSRDRSLWTAAHCDAPEAVWAWLESAATRFSHGNVAALALTYAASMDWIDSVVVGVELAEQL
ncbi:MAG: aldo/keto reductase, partial [Gammaproteobacteria bacterium]|nr:aldo/keto reductase [Gammaproteobacteria bacterium]